MTCPPLPFVHLARTHHGTSTISTSGNLLLLTTMILTVPIEQVEERLVSIDDLIDADEVFCTGTAVVVAPVSTVTYKGQR